MDCLDANAVQDFMSGALDPAARALAVEHLDTCDDCRDMISLLAKDVARDAAVQTLRGVGGPDEWPIDGDQERSLPAALAATGIRDDPKRAETRRAKRNTNERSSKSTLPTGCPRSISSQPGRTIGRYEIVERLGSGAMGIVYRATDPELGRDVALKILHVPDDELTERLVREARSMAKMNHPNVVRVYEVATAAEDQDVTFVAMELVQGGSFRSWQQTKRSVPEILEHYVAAGRGLAAAHAVGIVHRDFKPDNVLLGADGRVCVTDFGLAAFAGKPDEPKPSASSSSGVTFPDLALTQSGTVLGTPAYMAPEQFGGLPVDARTDQYAFCIALYEALYGERPFSGRSYEELGDNVCDGKRKPIPENALVSKSLQRIVLRGMSPKRDDRFPTMDALLAELARDRAKPWRRASYAAAAAAGLLALGIGADFVVRDRVTDEIAQSFAATGVQTNRAFRLLVQQFDANAKQMYYQKAIVDLGGLRDEMEFGLGNPDEEKAKRDEVRDQLVATDWSVWRQGIGSSLVIAVADAKGELYYTSADAQRWQTNLLELPWFANTSAAAHTILARTTEAALVKSGLLGPTPPGALGFFYVRPRVVNDEITSYTVQALDAAQLIPEIQLDDEMQLSIVAPDGTSTGGVPDVLARAAPTDHTTTEIDAHLVRSTPLTDRDGSIVGRVVMARRLDGVISGLFPGARLVFALALAAMIAAAFVTRHRGRRVAGTA